MSLYSSIWPPPRSNFLFPTDYDLPIRKWTKCTRKLLKLIGNKGGRSVLGKRRHVFALMRAYCQQEVLFRRKSAKQRTLLWTSKVKEVEKGGFQRISPFWAMGTNQNRESKQKKRKLKLDRHVLGGKNDLLDPHRPSGTWSELLQTELSSFCSFFIRNVPMCVYQHSSEYITFCPYGGRRGAGDTRGEKNIWDSDGVLFFKCVHH
jgi:hypothetical protein